MCGAAFSERYGWQGGYAGHYPHPAIYHKFANEEWVESDIWEQK
jgi:hypothetical protein